MQFTSGTQARDGRTVNHDPRPWIDQDGWRWTTEAKDAYSARGSVNEYRHDPRPEYAVLDNPILAELRRSTVTAPEFFDEEVKMALSRDPNYSNAYVTSTPKQIIHARRVLERLAALGERKTQ